MGRSGLLAVALFACSPPVVAPVDAPPPKPVAVAVPPAIATAPTAEPQAPNEPDEPPPPAPSPAPDIREWHPIRGRATCAGGVRCPKEAPLCAVSEAGARCVARGTPEHDAVPRYQRYACTRQSDCLGTGFDGCFHVVGERDFGLQTDCGGWPGYYIPAVCDQVADRCDEKKDSTCVPCKPMGGFEAEHLPWMGVW